MRDCLNLICSLSKQGYKLLFAALFGYYEFINWNYESVCFQRISICLFVIILIGFENCFAIIRTYIKKASFEYETTTILWIIFTCNQTENDEKCSDPNNDYFLVLNKFVFLLILIGNTIIYGIYFLIMVQKTIYACLLNPDDPNLNGGANQQPPQQLSDSLINQLESIRYNNTMSQYSPCSICQQDFEEQQLLIKTPCTHYFHQLCLQNWLRNKSSCPNCRFSIGQYIYSLPQNQDRFGEEIMLDDDIVDNPIYQVPQNLGNQDPQNHQEIVAYPIEQAQLHQQNQQIQQNEEPHQIQLNVQHHQQHQEIQLNNPSQSIHQLRSQSDLQARPSENQQHINEQTNEQLQIQNDLIQLDSSSLSS